MERRSSARVGKPLLALTLAAILVVPLAFGCGTAGSMTSPSTPVSGTDTMGTAGVTTTVGAGTATLQGRVTYIAAEPESPVMVNLWDVSEDSVAQTYAHDSFTFAGLIPGSYRLSVTAAQTGYISQWYGGLPVQTHPLSDSQVLQVGRGETEVDFVLQPGRSIRGHIAWSGADRDAGWVWAYDSSGQATGHAAGFFRYEPFYIVVGLVPGRYKVGATADDVQEGPQVWYGGAHSAGEAALVDVTEADATGIDIDLGHLSPTTSLISPLTTIP